VPLLEVFKVPLCFGTYQHWRARAREAREMAAQIIDPVAKQDMLAVADNYETVAMRAEAREVGVELRTFQKSNR
jgi:hypothetical protein